MDICSIAQTLRQIGADEVFCAEQSGSCMAVLRGGAPGKTLLLVAEPNCGADALLLDAANRLSKQKPRMHGTVKLLFGEIFPDETILADADAAFCLHPSNALEQRTCNFEAGPRMACADHFTLHVNGQASHASAPQGGHDAIVAAAAVVMALQSLVSRAHDPRSPLAVTVGTLNGGQKVNILAPSAVLSGMAHTFDPALRAELPLRIQKATEAAAAVYGCTVDCDYSFGSASVYNTCDALLALAQKTAQEQLGMDCLRPLSPLMQASPLGSLAEKIPAVYGFLGTHGTTGESHGAALYETFALSFLGEHS